MFARISASFNNFTNYSNTNNVSLKNIYMLRTREAFDLLYIHGPKLLGTNGASDNRNSSNDGTDVENNFNTN